MPPHRARTPNQQTSRATSAHTPQRSSAPRQVCSSLLLTRLSLALDRSKCGVWAATGSVLQGPHRLQEQQHCGSTLSKRGLAASRDDEGARKGMRLSPPSRLHCLQNSAPPPPVYFRAPPPPVYFRAPPPPVHFPQQRDVDVCLGDGMWRSMVEVPLGSAPARLLRLLRARLAALAGSALPGERPAGRSTSLGARPLPRVLELAASQAAHVTAFDRVGDAGTCSRGLRAPWASSEGLHACT